MIYHRRLLQWGLVRSVCPVRWSRCSLSSFHVSWRVSLGSPSDLCPVEICSQPAWQVGRLHIFGSLKITKSARENNVCFCSFMNVCVLHMCQIIGQSCLSSHLFYFQTGASSWHLAVGVMAVWDMVTSTMLHRYMSHFSLGSILYCKYGNWLQIS